MRAKYVLSEVAVGLWRNVTMTIAMIITMAVSLAMLGASLLMFLQVDQMKDFYYEQVEVSIFLKDDVTEEQRAGPARPRSPPTRWSKHLLRDQGGGVRASSRSMFADAPDLVDVDQPERAARVVPGQPERPGAVRRDRRRSTRTRTRGRRASSTRQALLEQVFSVLGAAQTLALVIAVVMASRRCCWWGTRSRSPRTANGARSR